jgi:hypothetical protein
MSIFQYPRISEPQSTGAAAFGLERQVAFGHKGFFHEPVRAVSLASAKLEYKAAAGLAPLRMRPVQIPT